MAKYHNKKETKKVGAQIKRLREDSDFSIEDISSMTGFARSTITSIENGTDTDTSHLIEIAKAIGVQPKEVFDIVFDLRPRYKLSPKRLAKNLLTRRITKMLFDSQFFEKPKFVKDVLAYLQDEAEIKADSTHASVVLKRLVKEGKLKYTKVGRQNNYSKRK